MALKLCAYSGGMRCANGHDNPPEMRFCGQCGQVLAAEAGAAGAEPSAAPEGESSTTADAEPSATATEHVQGRSKKPWIIFGVVVAVVVAAVTALLVRRSNEPSQIEEAAELCGVERNVGDDGTSITFDTEGEEDTTGDSITEVACVLSFLGTPDRVISQIDQTRALDGTLDASWDDYEVFWNYHPDSGMNLTVYMP